MVYGKQYLQGLSRGQRIRLARIRTSQFQQLAWLRREVDQERMHGLWRARHFGPLHPSIIPIDARIEMYLQRMRSLVHVLTGVWMPPGQEWYPDDSSDSDASPTPYRGTLGQPGTRLAGVRARDIRMGFM